MAYKTLVRARHNIRRFMFSRLLWRPYILLQKNEIYNQDDAEGHNVFRSRVVPLSFLLLLAWQLFYLVDSRLRIVKIRRSFLFYTETRTYHSAIMMPFFYTSETWRERVECSR